MSVNEQHLRHCFLYALQLKKTAAEGEQMIWSAFGEYSVSHSTSKKWFQTFKNGNLDLEDKECPGQRQSFEHEELEELSEENPCRMQSELVEALEVSRQLILKRLHKLRRIYEDGHWVPHVLRIEHKAKRHDTAMSQLSKFKNKYFLHKIVTCDGKWIRYNDRKRRKS